MWPKYLLTYWAILKNVTIKENQLWLLLGQVLEKLGLFLFLSAHTGGGVKLKNRQIMCFKEERVTTRNGTIYC